MDELEEYYDQLHDLKRALRTLLHQVLPNAEGRHIEDLLDILEELADLKIQIAVETLRRHGKIAP